MVDVINQVKSLSNQYNKDNNYTSGLDIQNFTIEPNYKYVKFSPADEEQEVILKSDSTLVMVDYPLNYQDADHYYIATGNEIPEEGSINPYYTSVPLNKNLPAAVPTQELDLMWLPDEDTYFEGVQDLTTPTQEGKIANKFDFINHIYSLAYQLSGNGNLLPPDQYQTDENDVTTKLFGISFRSRWTPRGNITIWDENIGNTIYTESIIVGYTYVPCNGNNDLSFNDPIQYESEGNGSVPVSGSSSPSGMEVEVDEDDRQRGCRVPIYGTQVTGQETGSYVPLVGAQVLIRDTFTLGNEITDQNGNFTFSRKRPAVRYLIQWERHNYSIRDGGWQASLKGPKMRNKAWNKRIRGGREDAYHAHIHRGTHMYYYENLPTLSGPPRPSGFLFQMKIAAVEADNDSNHSPFRSLISGNLLSRIRVKAWDENTENVIGVSIHELAHAVHWKVDWQAYTNLVHDAYIPPFTANGERDDNRRLMESYATHIEITYMDEFYNRSGLPFYQYEGFNLQDQSIGVESHYTTLVYDLTENFNQNTFFALSPIDNVENFTLREVQEALKNATDLDDYRANLNALGKDNPADILQLFINW